MGERQLLVALTALIAGVALSAQGPVYRECWGYMQLERLRDTVWDEMVGRSAATRNRIAELLVEPDNGVPFAPPARALAYLRNAEADDAFLLRAALGVFLLPEVVDPDATNKVCRQLNASLYLPFTVTQPGPLVFDVTVRDRGGASVFTSRIDKKTSVNDLRRARAVIRVPGAELADGTYVLQVRTQVGEVEARPTDPVLRLQFHVLRGYQQRSEAAMTTARDVSAGLLEVPRALLRGLSAQVARAYQGEAFSGESDAVSDLERLETALVSVAAGRHVLHGLTGDVPVELPAGERPIGCVLRLHEGRHPTKTKAHRPLIIFAGGLPAYDAVSSRPSAPATQCARRLASALEGFLVDESWQVAFLESPGGGRRYGSMLPAAIVSLRQVLSVGDAPVVLVCEREAAAVVGIEIKKIQAHIDGVVLVGAGAMMAPVLDGLQDLPVRIAMLHGYPSSKGLQRVLDYIESKSSQDQWNGDFSLLAAQSPAWLFGLRELAEPIASFARQLLH